ncbi:MAG: hypothetical protein FWD15_02805 [Alphaproteobacteria bacterium]|nr:hypothetical protein [Alphaproteobacteria bacterium]
MVQLATFDTAFEYGFKNESPSFRVACNAIAGKEGVKVDNPRKHSIIFAKGEHCADCRNDKYGKCFDCDKYPGIGNAAELARQLASQK